MDRRGGPSLKNRSTAATRVLDLVVALPSLILLLPVLLAVSVAVKITSPGPILFVQERVGRNGRTFRLLKFRSMRVERRGGADPLVTGEDDPRITSLGRWLRRTKLDELSQLWNLVRGDMSLVGPRPEVPRYVARYTPEQRRVLEARPGLTDPATLRFRDEEALLASVPPGQREQHYLREILPVKLALNLEYQARRGVWSDLRLVGLTVGTLLGGVRRRGRRRQKA